MRIDRVDALLEKTYHDVELCPAYIADVTNIMQRVKAERPPTTPLVLHFVSLSVAEVLRRRGWIAKMMLLTAMAVMDYKLARSLLTQTSHLFAQQVPPGLAEFIGAISGSMEKLAEMKDGETTSIQSAMGKVSLTKVALPEALKAKVKAKGKSKKTAKAKTLPPANPWN